MKNQPNRNYVSNDAVFTPEWLASALVAALSPSGQMLDPCCGSGAFLDALKPYGDVEWCERDLGRDFFQWTRPMDWVVTNPPWSQFAAFLEHALTVSDNVALLATVNHWWTKRRVRSVVNGGFGYRSLILAPWPEAFPSSGFQLGMMHVQRGYRGPIDVIDLRALHASEEQVA